eukprot:g2289.t1
MTARNLHKCDTSIELKVMLVEKSFIESTGAVSLTLVTVIAQSSEKIASVKATLRRFSMRTVLSLYYRGLRCDAKKTVDYYTRLGPDGLWQARLMQEIPPGQHKTAIDISNEGKKTVLMVPSSMPMSCFQDVLYHRLAIQPDKQHLSVNNRRVNENSRIRDYNWRKSEAIMKLIDETKDAAVESAMKYINFSGRLIEPILYTKRNEAENDVIVREVVAGLNIEGICCTPHCPVFGNNAVYGVGFNDFDMCLDTAFCPLCQGQMHVTNSGFHNCSWRIHGVKNSGNNEHSIETKIGQIDDDYVRCDPSRHSVSGKWSRLMLQASPLGVTKQCAVCRSLIESDDDYLTLACGDYMHLVCHQAWKNIDLRCPTCLQSMKN